MRAVRGLFSRLAKRAREMLLWHPYRPGALRHKFLGTHALTGVRNGVWFRKTLAREVERAQRDRGRLALVLLDVDDLKAINDQKGHPVGDRVLAEMASRVRKIVPPSGSVCRVGGDEFGVILPGATLNDADRLALRLSEASLVCQSPRPNELRFRPLLPS